MHCALPLCFVQLGVLLHEEDASTRFLYKVNNMLLTRVIGMLCELFEPSICYCDALTLGVVFTNLKALA